MTIGSVLNFVISERLEQEERWGEQNHSPFMWLVILNEEIGEACKAALEAGTVTTELEKDNWLQEYKKELIQVAAVAIAAIECIERGRWTWYPVER